ncbi:unnamed protein product, partial [Rangifer tarandus platyrhynchus]
VHMCPPSPPPRVSACSQQVHIGPFTPAQGECLLTAGSRVPPSRPHRVTPRSQQVNICPFTPSQGDPSTHSRFA